MSRLMNLMAANEPLYQAYLMKEDLRMFWNLPDAEAGKAFLDQWTQEVRALLLSTLDYSTYRPVFR